MNWKLLLLTAIPRDGGGSSSDQGGGADGSSANASMGDTGQGSGAGGLGGYGGSGDSGGGFSDAMGATGYGSFGLSGVVGNVGNAPAGMDVSNAVGSLGIGDIGMGGFGLSGITGTGPSTEGFGAGISTGYGESLSDPSGVAAGILGSVDFGSAFGPSLSPSIGLSTSVPGYSMTGYSAQMSTPSPMGISPGMVDTMGNTVATNAAVMGPAGQVALGVQEAIGLGVPGVVAGGPGITGGFGVAPGPSAMDVASAAIGTTTSPSTAVASAPSIGTTTSVSPSTAAPGPTTSAPSQTAAVSPTVSTPSMFDDPMGYVADKFSQALSNPLSTAVNLGVSAVPGLGLANTVSGLFGGPTLGGLAQSVANSIASGNFGQPGTATNVDGLDYGGDYGGQPGYSVATTQPSTVSPAENVGIASLSPVSYDISSFASPGLAGVTQGALSSPVGYSGPTSIAGPAFGLGDLTGTYSYTPA